SSSPCADHAATALRRRVQPRAPPRAPCAGGTVARACLREWWQRSWSSLSCLDQLEMRAEPLVRSGDQPPIEPPFAPARLVTGYQQDCVPARVERERDPPRPICGIEAQLLHVGVPRTIEGIHAWTPGGRPQVSDHHRLREKLVLDLLRQLIELLFEL